MVLVIDVRRPLINRTLIIFEYELSVMKDEKLSREMQELLDELHDIQLRSDVDEEAVSRFYGKLMHKVYEVQGEIEETQRGYEELTKRAEVLLERHVDFYKKRSVRLNSIFTFLIGGSFLVGMVFPNISLSAVGILTFCIGVFAIFIISSKKKLKTEVLPVIRELTAIHEGVVKSQHESALLSEEALEIRLRLDAIKKEGG